jgi:hypothetical protein
VSEHNRRVESVSSRAPVAPFLFSAFLRGVNIPGGRRFTSAQVASGLLALEPDATFVRTVGRPDSLLLSSDPTATEDSLRRAVGEALDCPCVVLQIETLRRIADAAIVAVRGDCHDCTPPYRVTADGVECEWCLVLSSDALPPAADGPGWLFNPTKNAIARALIERRALLARKRRHTPNGRRVMLGDAALNGPWRRTLRRNGVSVACLTSRTLNRIVEVLAAAKLT